MIYGYIRVSTDRQDCENQKLGIEAKAMALGLTIQQYIEDDGISGIRDPERRALGGLLRKIDAGDVILCSELSRLGRELFMIMRILEHCMSVGAKLYTVKDGYELGNNIQAKVLAFAFGLSAEIERDLISQRTKEALKKRKLTGVCLGRPRGSRNRRYKLDARRKYIMERIAAGASIRQIARSLRVAEKTVRDQLNKISENISA